MFKKTKLLAIFAMTIISSAYSAEETKKSFYEWVDVYKANISEDTAGHRYRTAEKLVASTRYVEGTDADRIRTFTIDAGVRISRNGFPEKAFSDFKIGDKVSVFYLPFYESQYKNTIPIYPEVILSSSEVK